MARKKRSAVPLRSQWVPALARAIDWHPQRLRNRFGKRGIVHPFAGKELAGLRMLKEEGIDFSKYRPSDDAVGVDLETLELAPRHGNGTAVVVRPPEQLVTKRKPHSHWGKKIVPRLARLLPEGDTNEGKMRVRWLLRQGGWTGKPGHVDEATALDIFKKANLSIANFEYAGGPGETRIGEPAATPEELAARLKTAHEQMAERDNNYRWLWKKVMLVRESLKQYEKQASIEFNAGRLPGLGVEPLNFPLDVLAMIRYDHQLLPPKQ